MKKVTKIVTLMMAILLSSTVIFAQGYGISEQEKNYNKQQELKLQSQHGPTEVVPASREVTATGDDCSDPIVITAGAIPYTYTDLGQYTCGRGNNYSATDLGSYDGGEDIIYELVISNTATVSIDMDPSGTTWTGLGLFTSCPSTGNSVSVVTGSSGTTVKNITTTLDPGTYYIMVDTWPSPNCISSFDLTVNTLAPPPEPDPIAVFPYMEDFESGSFPSTMVPETASGCDLTYESYAAADGSTYGLAFEGNTSTGWGSTPSNPTDAFAKSDHVAKLKMKVQPTGEPGLLTLQFDFRQNYSFNANYEWFRVTVDGTPIPDVDGNLYHQASSQSSDPWGILTYDLSPYQGSTFDLVIENSGKYYYNYYGGGDV